MNSFWQRWLTLWCVAVGLFGLVLYGAGYAATRGPTAVLFGAFGNPYPMEPDRYLSFTTSLMGAVTFGWSVALYTSFRAIWLLERESSASVWRILSVGVVIWYIIDSVASVANGFGLNAVSNTLFTVLFFVPVIASRALSLHR